jgi:phosphopantothenoylcysteine decarboxylase/phosphopantothenate--cysteine ligase
MGLIALGVSGGIGAYKAVELARGLQEAGHEVVAIMTSSARRFVGPLTFEAITKRRVITDQFAAGTNADIEHIALASDIEALVVAPATANIIGKLTHGIADDFLTTLYLATRAPVLLAPAMNTNMLEHAAVAANLRTLEDRGVHVVAPGAGYLACGWIGKGRLADPLMILEALTGVLRSGLTLSDRTILVTAGPTYEDLDPVRFVGNRSSGRMGVALAAEAGARGAQVYLILGPSRVPPPEGVDVVRVRSAADMLRAVETHRERADAIIMAAAVADYTTTEIPRAQKIAKDDGTLTLQLTPTTDILQGLGTWRQDRAHPVLVGFAAETHDVIPRAQAKLQGKRVDMIVANDVSRADAGFDAETNAVTLIEASGATAIPLQTKRAVAGVILDRVDAFLQRAARTVASQST